jgi:hypothetical protein
MVTIRHEAWRNTTTVEGGGIAPKKGASFEAMRCKFGHSPQLAKFERMQFE